jgi:7,8-dihydropterin-6-yl-methyl-4-(beta-D-ribofuranosyl)aminobenzene 5'-phosphate synthase
MADVGIGRLGEADLRSSCREVILTRAPTELAPGIWFSGEIPRTTAFEDTGGPFFADRAGRIPDPLNDDAALILDAPDGLIVLLGCAHSGVVNTLLLVRRMFEGKPIQTLLGGMHLVNASEERLQATIDALRDLEIARIAAGHCTGRRACEQLAASFGDRFMNLPAGTRFLFGRLPAARQGDQRPIGVD